MAFQVTKYVIVLVGSNLILMMLQLKIGNHPKI